jgi:hypothetical protein
VGTAIQAITLHTGNGGFTDALTDNYLKLRICGSLEANRWVHAMVEGTSDGVLVGLEKDDWQTERR